MKSNYLDIIEAAGDKEVFWYDQNGVPRFVEFNPKLCSNIYAEYVFLLLISCQACGKQFKVEMNFGYFDHVPDRPGNLHYGDPPVHDCVGDTMNCWDLVILEAWKKVPIRELSGDRWQRATDAEGPMDDVLNGDASIEEVG